ncbi:hypothetical protein BDY17DRAFT_44160 [Neohortaea acidophila]|uniref:Uncharacterized protein n=1 Tax=Neohortaea acidophila TaxID=245834 RepID=A0A6A6PIU8_9PEZI|nr:uncharacterized protein BDY17DRAFT_44160 [Neohortaea acidophila]KAF2479716.1 hypothetical protein BDY17DRAFT_44160 [Neohortaea acidophila]
MQAPIMQMRGSRPEGSCELGAGGVEGPPIGVRSGYATVGGIGDACGDESQIVVGGEAEEGRGTRCGAVRRDDGCGPRCGVDNAEWAMRWGRDGKRRRLLWPCGLAVLMERELWMGQRGGGDAAAEMGSGSLRTVDTRGEQRWMMS